MMRSGVPSRAAAIYWRTAFGLTVTHLAVFAYGLAPILAHWRELYVGRGSIGDAYANFGFVEATTYLLLGCFWLVWLLLLASDVAALWLLWRLCSGRGRRPLLIWYLAFVLGLLIPSEAAATKVFFSNRGGGILSGIVATYASGVAINDLLLAIPAAMIVAGGLVFGWARTVRPGGCTSCGYDLTGNTSGMCPECGTPIPARERRRVSGPLSDLESS